MSLPHHNGVGGGGGSGGCRISRSRVQTHQGGSFSIVYLIFLESPYDIEMRRRGVIEGTPNPSKFNSAGGFKCVYQFND